MGSLVTAVRMKGQLLEHVPDASVLKILASGEAVGMHLDAGAVAPALSNANPAILQATLTLTSDETFQALTELSTAGLSCKLDTMGSGYISGSRSPTQRTLVWLSRGQANRSGGARRPLFMTTWLSLDSNSQRYEITAVLFDMSNNS
ncbi:MAG: hypothetical protein AB7V46_22895 [Thermomicrobiales bacterium]